MSDLRRLDLMRGYRGASRELDREPTAAPVEERPGEAIENRIEERVPAPRPETHPRRTSRKPPLHAVRVAAAPVRRKAR